MKSFLQTAAIISALVLVPSFAFAQEAGVNAQVRAQATTTAPKPPMPFPKLGPAIKEVMDQARGGVRNAASTTKEQVMMRVDAIHQLVTEHKLDIRALIEGKREALGSSTPEQREEMRAATRAQIDAKKAELSLRVDAAKTTAQEKFAEGVQRSVSNIAERLKKSTEDLSSIAARLDTRIKEYEAAGKDMSISVTLLTGAQGDIIVAQDHVTAVGGALNAALLNTNPKSQMESVRAAVKKAEDALKTAKESLKKALESVRTESSVEASASASATTN